MCKSEPDGALTNVAPSETHIRRHIPEVGQNKGRNYYVSKITHSAPCASIKIEQFNLKYLVVKMKCCLVWKAFMSYAHIVYLHSETLWVDTHLCEIPVESRNDLALSSKHCFWVACVRLFLSAYLCMLFAVAVRESACCKCHPSSDVCAACALVERGKVPMLQIPAFDLDTKGRPAANALRREGKFP